jgi:iron-sulfur cluster repair protein YtfE (RIC family)
MDRTTVRNRLLAQHERIRADVAECRGFAQRMRDGEPVTADLELALARLRTDFDDHNRTETGLLLPLLLHDSEGRGTRGTRLAERMLEEHAAEHAAFWARLLGPPAAIATRMDELAEELDAHMAAEERTFLSPVLLRDDELARRVPGGESSRDR